VSIIEKAADRLGKSGNEAPVPRPDAAQPAVEAAGAEFQPLQELPASGGQAPHATAPFVAAPAQVHSPVSAPIQAAPRASAPVADAPGSAGGGYVEINMALLERMGMVTKGMGRTPVAEEFRMIKRPLLQGAFNSDPSRHSNLIMVTSSLPGEGKTFCSINLAMSIAMEMDHTVLLVDADVARPSVLRTLGLEARPGLMDVLLDDKLELSDVMLRTNVDTLRILPAGRLHSNATELLASQSMTNLLDQIAQRYPDRIVIFDSPPLLLTSESKALASNMGQIVLVVEAETTTQHALKDAIRRIGATSNVSLIYNKTKAFSGDGSYGYGYN
jgi:exopolysaccharide/PEP-CTERM locus tyrosine autokinase